MRIRGTKQLWVASDERDSPKGKKAVVEFIALILVKKGWSQAVGGGSNTADGRLPLQQAKAK